MAKKKAAKKKPAPKKRTTRQAAPTARLKGLTFFLAGRWFDDKQELAAVLAVAGGKLAEKLTKDVDYIVVERKATGTTPAEKQAAKLNANANTNIQVVACRAAAKLAMPTPGDVVAVLASGKGVEAWKGIHRLLLLDRRPGLANANLQNAKLPRADFYFVKVDGANFTGADLSGSYWLRGGEICLDGAILHNAGRINLKNSSAKRLDAAEASFERLAECNLDGANLERASIHGLKQSSFRKAHCRKLKVSGGQTIASDFSAADLSQADLEAVNLSGSTLRGAKLVETRLNRCNFNKADLSNADMRNARLIGANLTGAKVDGANFTGANLMNAKFKGVDFSKAKGFDPTAAVLTSGPALRQFEAIVKKASDLKIKAEVILGNGHAKLTVARRDDGVLVYYWTEHVDGGASKPKFNYLWNSRSFSQTLLEAADFWRSGTLRIDSIRVIATKPPVQGKDLKNAAVAACCEAFGIRLADEEQTKPKAKKGKPSPSQLRKELLEELLGKGGVKKFNAHTQAEIAKAGSFRKIDLAGACLNGVRFPIMDLQAANFEGTALSKSQFEQCKCHQANFKKANLQTANLTTSGFNNVDFTDANLAKANLVGCSLRKARFNAANLAGANLTRADLTGADFTSADLKGAKLLEARFDEVTKFPKGFKLPEDMDWRGKGASPAMQVRKKKPGSLSIEDFMERLGESVDTLRLKKAVKMLKADRFQLYVQMDDDHLVGVVKSQSDKDLVYSCQLTRDGAFACCTQNLNVCGGLRGAVCKHLLVLIVGLAKTGDIDAAEIDNWIAASKAHKPALDKDVMSETLLRYKGAEAGEIDWRPTETVPEDYYAF